MKKINMESIRPLGDLHKRADRTFTRLESDIYQPDYIRNQEQNTDWPGDWGGRTLLAISMMSRAMDRKSVYVDEIFEVLWSLRNERGYLGNIEEPEVFDEQQFSGHNWLLRGLLHYHAWRGDARSMEFARDIVRNLYLPATGFYTTYPVDPQDHVYAGGKSGTVTGAVVKHWRTSSDTGCAFMCLDGLTDYYTLTDDEAVGTLLKEMIDTFMTIDFVKLSMQTHASLSATRGVLKMYRKTLEPQYLAFARRLFSLYLDYGATVNYANYNWFCRAGWTEPCAIIDSYILCFDLFCATEDPAYLQDANRIHYNALDFAQRFNGGFGCDVCVGPEKVILRADAEGNGLCEAFWCCTMRGGEGMSAVIGNTYLLKDNTLVLAQYSDSVLKTDDLLLTQKTAFPYAGKVELTVERQTENIRRLALYVPAYAENMQILLNGAHKELPVVHGFATVELENATDRVELSFDMGLRKEKCIGRITQPNAYSFWHGDLMLGVETLQALEWTDVRVERTEAGYHVLGSDRYLTDLRGNVDLSPESPMPVKSIQVLFC